MSKKKTKKAELYDATGKPYKSKLKALLFYYEIEFDNPRKQLAIGMPIDECTQVDIREIDTIKEKYDLIAAVMSLQCLTPHVVPATIDKMASLLNLKGELYVVTPSFEWAAEQVNAQAPHPLIHMMMCGTEKVPNRCVFTLAWIRQLVQQSNLVIRYATQEAYQVQLGDNKETLVRNLVIGWKYDEFDSTTALDSDIALS